VKSYAFILGSHPILSYAEIINLLRVEGISFRELSYNSEFTILEIEKFKETSFQKKLGGTIRIVEIKEELKTIFQAEEVLTEKRLFDDFLAKKEGKILLGVTAYTSSEFGYAERNALKRLGVLLKESLKAKHSIRYLSCPSFNLPSIVVSDLITKGAEIALLKDGQRVFLGKTVAVQDIRGYKERDFDRPQKDLLAGVLPPKLAQMIINLTRSRETKGVFDPFCGSGGILQEACLLGLEVFGSDWDRNVLKKAEENIRWSAEVMNKKAPADLARRLRQADAREIKWAKVNKKGIVVVTEPYLGPPQRRRLLSAQAENLMKELKKLYVGFFKNLARNFPQIGRVGIVLPVAKTTSGLVFLEILDELTKLGYKRKAVLPSEILKRDPGITKRQGFLYSRPDQFILREIFVFER